MLWKKRGRFNCRGKCYIVMQKLEDLFVGKFNNIEDVISLKQLSEHSKKYKKVAGFSIKELNSQESIIKL